MPPPSPARQTRPLVLMPHDVGGNIFIPQIAAGYAEAGYDVVLGRENLTHLACTPAIVHLHWPEEHFEWRGDPRPAQARANALLESLDRLKARGAKIAWQVHNVRPHEARAPDLEDRVYQGVIDRTDLIVHHCDVSVRMVSEHYRIPESTRHVVTPFGNFLAYPNTSDRAAARARLRLPPERLVYLHFGAIRAYKGLDLLLESFAMARCERKFLLIAGRFEALRASPSPLERVRFALARRWTRGVRFDIGMVPDDEVQYYMNASDVVVLAHRAGLNSGVGVLGMTFGRTIVGPECGCIEGVLRAGDNITYPAGDTRALARALEAAAAADREAIGARNRMIASRWRWQDTALAVVRELHGAVSPTPSTAVARVAPA